MMRRRLSPEERALWDRVARSAEPLPGRPRPPAAPPAPAVMPPGPLLPAGPAAAPAPRPAAPLPAFRIGERAAPPSGPAPAGTSALALAASAPPRKPLRMDARIHGRLRKGRLHPEARIDLHGMTLAQAHRALTGFILGARASGQRLVLVITGKGRPRAGALTADPLPPGRGLLREQVPDWLTLPPLDALVLDVTPAHQSHGGGGALYVYLRRR